MKNNRKPELLAPAGSMDSLYAAVNNGCDAVYLGGKQFSARQYAGNFSNEELQQVCNYCHLRNVKVYVTVNTLYKDSELENFVDFIQFLYQIGVDAIIVQDLGVAHLVQKYCPDFPLHASTQLTSNSIEDVKFLEENGFEKIVLSRELSLEEIQIITENSQVEIETFVHGALCVSYSGQCIMSSMLGGRSGNRGRCAQTCRLPYSLYLNKELKKEGYLLSPKDIQTITILPELIDLGISSFKIEGRMKNSEYVAGVTSIYRKYIDSYFNNPKEYQVDEKDMKILLQLFNRGGFSEGYYKTHSGSDMMGIIRPKTWGLKTGFVDSYNEKLKRATIRTREPLVPGDGIEVWTQKEPHTGTNISRASKAGEVISLIIDGNLSKNDVVYKTHDKALSDALKKTWEKDFRKKEIFGSFQAKINSPMTLKLWDMNNNSVFIQGDMVSKAQNQPITSEKIRQQLSKTGSTPFYLQDISLVTDENIYISISSLNDLRRKATDALVESILKKSKRKLPNQAKYEKKEKNPILKKKKMNVLVSTMEQFDEAVAFEPVNIIYFEMQEEFEKNLEICIQKCKREKKQLFAALPRIYRNYSKKLFSHFLNQLEQSDIDGYLLRSPGEYHILKNSAKLFAIDYSLNAFNREDIEFWQEKGVESITISPELNLQEIEVMATDICEMLVYGYLPLMTTHQCPVGSFVGGKTAGIYCNQKGKENNAYLKDRKGIHFPILTDCNQCVATILNSKPLFTLKFFDEILNSPTGSVRLLFTREDAKETRNILYAYGDMLTDCKNTSIDVELLMDFMSEKGSTKGHYFRGVE